MPPRKRGRPRSSFPNSSAANARPRIGRSEIQGVVVAGAEISDFLPLLQEDMVAGVDSKVGVAGFRSVRRHRTQVRRYTDDDPATFTKKKKKRGRSEEESSESGNNEDDDNASDDDAQVEEPTGNGEGDNDQDRDGDEREDANMRSRRRGRQPSPHRPVSTSKSEDSDAVKLQRPGNLDAKTNGDDTELPPTEPPVKRRGPGRPPKKKRHIRPGSQGDAKARNGTAVKKGDKDEDGNRKNGAVENSKGEHGNEHAEEHNQIREPQEARKDDRGTVVSHHITLSTVLNTEVLHDTMRWRQQCRTEIVGAHPSAESTVSYETPTADITVPDVSRSEKTMETAELATSVGDAAKEDAQMTTAKRRRKRGTDTFPVAAGAPLSKNERQEIRQRLRRDPALRGVYGPGLGPSRDVLARASSQAIASVDGTTPVKDGGKSALGSSVGGITATSGSSGSTSGLVSGSSSLSLAMTGCGVVRPPQWTQVRYHDFYDSKDYELSDPLAYDDDDDNDDEDDECDVSAPQHVEEGKPENNEANGDGILLVQNALHGDNREKKAEGIANAIQRKIPKKRCRIREDGMHVSRACTCMAISSSGTGAQYVALGDTAGYVSIYITTPFLSSVNRLETSASRRDYIEESEARRNLLLRLRNSPGARRALKKFGVATAEKQQQFRRSQVTGKRGGGEKDGRTSPSTKSVGGSGNDETTTNPTSDGDHADGANSEGVNATQPHEETVCAAEEDPKEYDDGKSTKSSHHRGRRNMVPATKSTERHHTLASQSPNSIEALCFAGVNGDGNDSKASRIAVATKVEVELIDCVNGTIVWTCATRSIPAASCTSPKLGGIRMSRGPAVRLDCHEKSGDVLAGFSFTYRTPAEEKRLKGRHDDSDSRKSEDPTMLSPVLRFRTSTPGSDASESVSRAEVDGVVPNLKTNWEALNETKVDATQNRTKRVVLGPKSVAIWDRSDESRIVIVCLCVRSFENGDEASSVEGDPQHVQEILLVKSSSLSIVERSEIPIKITGSKVVTSEALNQTERGTYTLASSTAKGGIHLFRTDDLSILGVYGEGIALHGHTIAWQQCFFINLQSTDPSSPEKNGDTIGRYILRDDEFREKSNSPEEKKETLDELLIVGIPNAFREPVEMRDNIYFWQVEDPTISQFGGTKSGDTLQKKLPCFTLNAPPKARGVSALIYHAPKMRAESGRFIVCTQSGDCQELIPNLNSDWPGTMYSPGYHLVDDNLVFYEDEEELDKVVDAPRTGLMAALPAVAHENLSSISNEESALALALQRSWLESKMAKSKQTDIDVVTRSAASVADSLQADAKPPRPHCLIPCHPEPFVYAASDTDGLPTSSGPSQSHAGTGLLGCFPQLVEVESALESQGGSSENVNDSTLAGQSSNEPSTTRSTRGKRAKPGSLEAILASSIVSAVRHSMAGKERWALGDKANMGCYQSEPQDSADVCEACRGRMVTHTCGKRVKPVDHEALAEAERRRKEKEEEERKLARLEKKRAMDAKRREERRQKKRDEEARKKEEEERLRAEAERAEYERRQLEEEQRRAAEEDRIRMEEEEERRRAEEERQRMEEDIRRQEEERQRIEEEERQRIEEEERQREENRLRQRVEEHYRMEQAERQRLEGQVAVATQETHHVPNVNAIEHARPQPSYAPAPPHPPTEVSNPVDPMSHAFAAAQCRGMDEAEARVALGLQSLRASGPRQTAPGFTSAFHSAPRQHTPSTHFYSSEGASHGMDAPSAQSDYNNYAPAQSTPETVPYYGVNGYRQYAPETATSHPPVQHHQMIPHRTVDHGATHTMQVRPTYSNGVNTAYIGTQHAAAPPAGWYSGTYGQAHANSSGGGASVEQQQQPYTTPSSHPPPADLSGMDRLSYASAYATPLENSPGQNRRV